MLHQELTALDSAPAGASRWLVPGLVAVAALSALVLFWLIGAPVVGAAAAVIVAGLYAAVAVMERLSATAIAEPLAVAPDYALVGSALALCGDAAALTMFDGSLLIANSTYRERFGSGIPPLELAKNEDDRQSLELARTLALRDGAGCAAGLTTASAARESWPRWSILAGPWSPPTGPSPRARVQPASFRGSCASPIWSRSRTTIC